jgi:serine/threonine protein kinase
MPGVLRPPALVTEYMAGGSLKSALARRADIVAGPLTRLVLALDAAKGLEYLHSKKICHFDVKSGNLLLGYRDRRPVCKVADFGLAREKVQTFVSGVTSQRGTLPWTAPEILRSPDAVTEKVDVFSFGIVMWELWTGKEPYEGLNYHALMVQLANPEARLRPPVPGSPEWDGEEAAVPPELAPGWKVLMERCWAEDPEDRPSFTQVIRELREMISVIKPQRNTGSMSHGHGRSAVRASSG